MFNHSAASHHRPGARRATDIELTRAYQEGFNDRGLRKSYGTSFSGVAFSDIAHAYRQGWHANGTRSLVLPAGIADGVAADAPRVTQLLGRIARR